MEAATEWIAPFWSSLPFPDPHQVAVWILNPSDTKQAKVTVRFNNFDGSLYSQNDLIVPKRSSSATVATATSGEVAGWVHVISNEPVLPWGRTPSSSGSSEFVQMTFFRQAI